MFCYAVTVNYNLQLTLVFGPTVAPAVCTEASKITARWWLGWFGLIFTEVKAAPLIGFSCCSVTEVVSSSLQPHWLQHARLPCPSLSHSFLNLSIESMMLSNHLILFRPFLGVLPSIFPSIKVFSSESTVSIRWSKYWSFSISCNVLLMLVNHYTTYYLNRMMNHPIPVYFHKLYR